MTTIKGKTCNRLKLSILIRLIRILKMIISIIVIKYSQNEARMAVPLIPQTSTSALVH